jgi:hypothetical protein
MRYVASKEQGGQVSHSGHGMIRHTRSGLGFGKRSE